MKKLTQEYNQLSLNQALVDGSCIMGMNYENGKCRVFFKGNAHINILCTMEQYIVFRNKWKELGKINSLTNFKNVKTDSARYYINSMIKK